MSDKPTTGEWTEGKVFAYFESEDFKGLADAINSEREEGVKALAERSFELHECKQQLAAERETLAGKQEFRLLNLTTMLDVIDADSDDGSPVKFSSFPDAVQGLQRVNDLKKLNPKHANDEITIYPFTRP